MPDHLQFAPEHLRRIRESSAEYMATTAELLAAGGPANRQYALRGMADAYVTNGCIALLLGDGDDAARHHFARSIPYAVELIGTPGPLDGGLRVFDVELSGRPGSAVTATVQRRQPLSGAGKLSISHFEEALQYIGCFGDESQIRTVASVPDDDYDNPEVQASGEFWAYLRAIKAALLGDMSSAKLEVRAARGPWWMLSTPESRALQSVLDGNQVHFRNYLAKGLARHRKAAAPLVRNTIYFRGLLLCRLAAVRGMSASDTHMLPTRLLGQPAGTVAG